jgi:ABC-type polysaccharide/polyol phosphate export permease
LLVCMFVCFFVPFPFRFHPFSPCLTLPFSHPLRSSCSSVSLSNTLSATLQPCLATSVSWLPRCVFVFLLSYVCNCVWEFIFFHWPSILSILMPAYLCFCLCLCFFHSVWAIPISSSAVHLPRSRSLHWLP